jgi:hypothetical protein
LAACAGWPHRRGGPGWCRTRSAVTTKLRGTARGGPGGCPGGQCERRLRPPRRRSPRRAVRGRPPACRRAGRGGCA